MLNVVGRVLLMVFRLSTCEILVRICDTTNLQYDRCMIRCYSSRDHGLLCKSFFNFFSENNAPIVMVVSILFISFMSYSSKLLLLILFCIALALTVVLLEVMYSMRTFLYLDTFFGCVDDNSLVMFLARSMNGLRRYWIISISRYSPL